MTKKIKLIENDLRELEQEFSHINEQHTQLKNNGKNYT